jgi:hypothetical protein
MTFVTTGLAIAGLASVAVPILIFLLWRQRRTPIDWAAMRFLIEAFRRHRRRLRTEQLLLLAIRCLILAALGAALARPLLEGTGLLDAGGTRLVYLVIDDGLASGAEAVPGTPALDRQIAHAVDIVSDLAPGDRVALVTAARPARMVLDPPATDHAGVIEMLESIEPRQSPTDVAGALDRIASRLAGRDDDRDQVVVYLLSDFRAGSAPLEQTLPGALAQLGSRVVLRAAPPAVDPLANVQITAIEPARRLLLAGAVDGSGQVTVRLARQGGELGHAVSRVSLRGDDLPPVAPAVVEWGPGESDASVRFTLDLPPSREREVGITAVIEADGLAADNERHTVLALRKAIRVVLIDRRSFGYEPSLERLTAGQWVRRALAPAVDGPVEVIEVEPAALESADVRGADVAILPRPDLVTDEGWSIIRRFVDKNGLLVVSPPTDRTVHQWPDEMIAALGLPWQLERETRELPDSVPLALEQPSTALLRMIASDLEELSRPVLVHKMLAVDATKTQAETVLRLADTAPLVIAGTPSPAPGAGVDGAGADPPPAAAGGLVVYLATAPQLEWSNLPSKPLMVPFFHEVLRQGVSLIRGRAPIGVATRPPLVVGPAAAGLVAPGGERIALDDVNRPERELDKPGLFEVVDLAGQPVGVVAVNVETAAGRTDPQPASAVQTWLGRSGPWEWFDPDDVAAELRRAERGSPLAGLLLVLVLLLLVVETVLARVFSHADVTRAGGGAPGLRPTMHERPVGPTGLATTGGGA